MGTVKSKVKIEFFTFLHIWGGGEKMKLYSVSDEYINFLRCYDNRVYSNKQNSRKVTRKYLGIVLDVESFLYYVPMSSPKKSDYINNKIRKSIIPIIRMISKDENTINTSLKGTLRIGNMIPVPKSELVLYEPKLEKDSNYKILIEKELEFIEKNEEMIKKYAKIVYNQKTKDYNVSYIKNVVNFRLLEEKCKIFIQLKSNMFH